MFYKQLHLTVCLCSSKNKLQYNLPITEFKRHTALLRMADARINFTYPMLECYVVAWHANS